MKLSVYVLGRDVAVLESVGDFQSVLTYEPTKPIELGALLQGDNSEEAFAELVRQHAASGVSGVVPKFLDAQDESTPRPSHNKATFVTHRHIIKGSTKKLPYVSLKFLTAVFGISVKSQTEIVEAICEAVSATAPQVRRAMKRYEDFKEIGARMLITWNEGIKGLRDARMYSLPPWKQGKAFEGLAPPPKLATPRASYGRSEALAVRSKKSRRTVAIPARTRGRKRTRK